jgi:hypothetical protein
LRLRFLSPLRLRVDGRYCSRPSFPSLVQALVRRLNLLLALYGRGQPDPAWARPVLAQADAARLIGADFRPFLWSRFSGRQHERILMDGITGAIEVQGDLTELAGWLLLGEALYLGSGTSLGLGRYRVSLEGA